MYVVICPCFPCGLKDCVVYGAWGFECGASVFSNELSMARVEVWQFGCGGGVVLVMVVGYWPCSEAADGGSQPP